jgi:hypothetical protein
VRVVGTGVIGGMVGIDLGGFLRLGGTVFVVKVIWRARCTGESSSCYG